MELEGNVAVVTGASRGIGRAVAVALAEAGARLALVARSLPSLEETRTLLPPGTSELFSADLRDRVQVQALTSDISRVMGDVDILVNVAGVWHNGSQKYYGPALVETPAVQIDEVINVGLVASIHLARLLLPSMIRRKRGKIIQLSCGFAGPHEARGWLHYYVANEANKALTRGLASELREHEIQVNCVAPWFVATEAVHRFFPEQVDRAVSPAEVAGLVTFLSSRKSDHITGQVIEVRSKADRDP